MWRALVGRTEPVLFGAGIAEIAHHAVVRSTLLTWMVISAIGCAASRSPAPPIAATPAATVAPAPARVEPPTPEPAAPPEPVIEGYTPEVATTLARARIWWLLGSTRIAIARRGAIRLRPDGPDLGLRDDARFPTAERLPVLDDGERPRIVTEDRDIRLLLHVDREDAKPVVLRAAPLRPDPATSFGDPPRRGHVVLQPGAWVDVTMREGSAAQVVYGEPKPTMSGWIDTEALGTTFTAAETSADPPDERQAYLTKRTTTLRTRPGGKVLATLERDAAVLALTPHAEAGHRLVQHRPVCEDDFVYVGFVRARDLHQPNHGFGHGCGSGSAKLPRLLGEAESAPRVTLEAGRFLLDADSPTIVGCVLASTEVADLGDGRYAVATIWGPVPVRLAPASFEGQCGTRDR